MTARAREPSRGGLGPSLEVGTGRRRGSRLSRLLFPQGVRVWHFILVPAVGMGVFLLLSRLLDQVFDPWFARAGHPDLYVALRSIVIAILMASLIAYLAVQYRSGYEEQLRSRNETLERTRDFLSGIIEGSAEAIITRDAEGRITSWNPAAEAIYGWSAAEVLGDTVGRLLPDDEARKEAAEIRSRVGAGETVQDYETVRVRKDGKRITVRLTMAPLFDVDGRIVGTSAIVRDVTALKDLESRLLEKERLAAVGELAAMVAHEVRNPLAGIRGGCEILLEGYSEGDPRNEIGNEVLHQVDRLNRTVHDLLLFARPKAMDPVPTDLHALIDRLVTVLREDPDNSEIAIERRYDPELPVVRVDARQIEQVFLNLLLNAGQAMGHTGTVTVSTRLCDGSVEVAFRDLGPGIAPDKIDHIFKPFFTTRAQGTGLGLAIVKKIVEAHEGRIDVANEDGGGARFVVTLPLET